MAWVKLDDAMPGHPKVMAAGPQAFALDVAGICYSNKHATDGFIATHSLAAVLPCLPNAKRWAARLVEVGRWHPVDGGWRIHDIADYQPTAEEQKDISRKRAAAGRKGGTKSGETRRSKIEADAKQVASTEPNPDPTRTTTPPNGGAVDGLDTFVRRLARTLREDHDQELPRRETKHDAYRDLLAGAVKVFPEDQHRGITLGVIADYHADIVGEPLTKDARSHLARHANSRDPLDVFDAVSQALNWGAGVGDEYRSDDKALSKYVTAVLTGRRAS